jgi:uncharacterized protein YbjT (DUF2867 family)
MSRAARLNRQRGVAPQDIPATGGRGTGSVLITGASGNLGREVLTRLRSESVPVRALDRRWTARAGAESVVGDLVDRRAMRDALAGVDVVFLIWPLLEVSPAEGLMEELSSAGPRVVYLSSTAIDDSSTHQSDRIVQVHADMENLLRGAGLRLTTLRSDTLASNARAWGHQVRAGDVVSGPDIARTAVVDERDVAAAAAAALINDAGPGPYLLTGPESLTRADQVATLGEALGRPLRFEPLEPELARTRMLADGRPPQLVDALVDSSLNRAPSTLVTDHVQRLTGTPAGSFARWVGDHVDEFR